MKKIIFIVSAFFGFLIFLPLKNVYAQFTNTAKAEGNTFSTALVFTTPTPTPNNGVFPSCTNVLPSSGDTAHYATGTHQIVGGPLLPGSDDVYSLANGNYLQCFCPVDGTMGIQTNWLRTNDPVIGWFFENGSQWNLGNYNYAAQNISFSCTSEPVSTPTPIDHSDRCEVDTDFRYDKDGHGFFHFDVKNCKDFKKFTFHLDYDTDRMPEGVDGRGDFDNDGSFDSRNIILGTCSSNDVCDFDKNPRHFKISLRVYKDDNDHGGEEHDGYHD